MRVSCLSATAGRASQLTNDIMCTGDRPYPASQRARAVYRSREGFYGLFAQSTMQTRPFAREMKALSLGKWPVLDRQLAADQHQWVHVSKYFLTTAVGCFCIYAGRLSEVFLNVLLTSGLLLKDVWLLYNNQFKVLN